MTHKRKGQLTTSPEWAKHLRGYMKRQFWKGERKAEQSVIRNELDNISIEEIPDNTEVVICVLANERAASTVFNVLDHFIPVRNELNIDYTHPTDDSDKRFDSEYEMIKYFEENKSFSQVFYYWNSIKESKVKLSIGADFTDDGYLIISIVHIANGEREHSYLNILKDLLQSEYGTFMYGGIPEYEDGEDFKMKYTTQQRLNVMGGID